MFFRRKTNRLKNYDYSSNGLYFITICAENRSCIFGKVVNEDIVQGASVVLSETGALVQTAIDELPGVFPGIGIHDFVVMPNHLHMLIELKDEMISISSIINYFKGNITRRARRTVWQKSFHDHIVRDETDYQRIWKYIEANPGKWSEDRYYCP